MNRVVIIGAGGVGGVFTSKCACSSRSIFRDRPVKQGRAIEKCEKIKKTG